VNEIKTYNEQGRDQFFHIYPIISQNGSVRMAGLVGPARGRIESSGELTMI
jgi:hypothetical protein